MKFKFGGKTFNMERQSFFINMTEPTPSLFFKKAVERKL